MSFDDDSDGMPNKWEESHGLDYSNSSDASLDGDRDGLTNLEEYQNGCDPWNNDTDADGLADGWEVANGLNPTVVDTDGDGLDDNYEVTHGLDPLSPDTDGDGMPDGWEVAHGFNATYSDDGVLDADGDGVSNSEEYLNGCDPLKADTDNDGLPDGLELALPLNATVPTDGYAVWGLLGVCAGVVVLAGRRWRDKQLHPWRHDPGVASVKDEVLRVLEWFKIMAQRAAELEDAHDYKGAARLLEKLLSIIQRGRNDIMVIGRDRYEARVAELECALWRCRVKAHIADAQAIVDKLKSRTAHIWDDGSLHKALKDVDGAREAASAELKAAREAVAQGRLTIEAGWVTQAEHDLDTRLNDVTQQIRKRLSALSTVRAKVDELEDVVAASMGSDPLEDRIARLESALGALQQAVKSLGAGLDVLFSPQADAKRRLEKWQVDLAHDLGLDILEEAYLRLNYLKSLEELTGEGPIDPRMEEAAARDAIEGVLIEARRAVAEVERMDESSGERWAIVEEVRDRLLMAQDLARRFQFTELEGEVTRLLERLYE